MKNFFSTFKDRSWFNRLAIIVITIALLLSISLFIYSIIVSDETTLVNSMLNTATNLLILVIYITEE